jgi:hypothetical protein
MTSMPQSDHAAVKAELARLDIAERTISGRRNLLHRRIDSLYLRAPLGLEESQLLHQLESLEEEVSRERRELHVRIDEIRQSIGLPTWREERRRRPGVLTTG